MQCFVVSHFFVGQLPRSMSLVLLKGLPLKRDLEAMKSSETRGYKKGGPFWKPKSTKPPKNQDFALETPWKKTGFLGMALVKTCNKNPSFVGLWRFFGFFVAWLR